MADSCPLEYTVICTNHRDPRPVARADCGAIMQDMRDMGFSCVCWQPHEDDPDMCYILVSDSAQEFAEGHDPQGD